MILALIKHDHKTSEKTSHKYNFEVISQEYMPQYYKGKLHNTKRMQLKAPSLACTPKNVATLEQ